MESLKIVGLIGLVSLYLGLTGCKQLQPVVTTDNTSSRTITVTETLHDTTLIVKPDSASIKALFGCDSLNQVFLRELAVEKGRKIDPVVKWLPGGVLEVTAKVDSQAVYLAWKERHVLEVDSTKVSKVVTVKEKPPWWQRLKSNILVTIAAGVIIVLILSRSKQK